MIEDNFKFSEITKSIINAFYNVYNKLGYGFLERVYENAMMIELKKLGLNAVKQQAISVYYDDELVGEYFADIIVDNKVIIELKAAETICSEHECQLVNYLKSTDIEVGLLLNFGKKPEIKRRVLTSDHKKSSIS
jgi:GxxExxY protein